MTDKVIRLLGRRFFVLGCLWGLAVSGSAWAADDKQEKVPMSYIENLAELKTGQVFQSEEQRNKKIFQVAKVLIKASPEAVYKVFTDYNHAPAIFSNLKKCKVISSVGQNKQVWFEAAAGGGLLKFEYVLEFKEHPPNSIEWHRVSGAFKTNEGDWKFEPRQNGQCTLVTYSKYVEAGFPFPQFLVRKELKDNMPTILTELKKRLENL